MDEGSAAELHGRAYVFDAHSDNFIDVAWYRSAGERQVMERRHLPEARAGGVDAVVIGITAERVYKPYQALPRVLQLLGAGLEDLAESPQFFRIVREGADFARASQAGQIAVVLQLEGGEPVEYSTESLRVFWEVGIRSLIPAWSYSSRLATGAWDYSSGGGLTPLGEQMVREANRLGVVIDVSHLAPTAVSHVLRVTRRPVIASHSNAAALHPHPRNLPDDLIKAIAGTGGVIGIASVDLFLAREGASIEHVVQQIEYLLDLVGDRHVGLGLDMNPWEYRLHEVATSGDHKPLRGGRVEGFSEWRDLPALTNRLLQRGHSETTIRNILGENFRRFYAEALS